MSFKIFILESIQREQKEIKNISLKAYSTYTEKFINPLGIIKR